MPLPWLVVFLPWAGALLVAAVPGLRLAALLNLGVSAASLLLALFLFGTPMASRAGPGWMR